MIIHIKNLRLKANIGTDDCERNNKQDIIINVKIEYDGTKAAETDNLNDTVNYYKITKQIIEEVEQSEFLLLEKLANHILQIVMQEPLVETATIEVDKPHAIHQADSVSIRASASKK